MSDLFKDVGTGNFGNSVIVSPADSPGNAPNGYGPVKTIVKFPGSVLIARQAQEADPAVVTASVFATPTPNANTEFGGPVTGIALWGSGDGGTQQAEFDIPSVTSNAATFNPSPDAPFFGGALICVPASALEIRARNDQNFVPSPTGPGGAVVSQQIGSNQGGDILVTASIGKGTRGQFNRLTKTVWVINVAVAGTGLAIGANTSGIIIPPFATSFRVLRAGPGLTASAIVVWIGTPQNQFAEGGYLIAASTLSPEFPLSGQETLVTIENSGGVTLDSLAIIFFLSI